MRRTTLVIDDRKLQRARRILGTRGIQDTVDRTLDEVLALDARKRALEQLTTITLDMGDEAVMRDAWT